MQGALQGTLQGKQMRRRAILGAMLAAPVALAANAQLNTRRVGATSVVTPTGAPIPPAQITGATGSRFGVVTHIATRYGLYGQQGGPIDLAAGTGAGWVREEIRWDWVEHPLGTYDWGFMDEMVQKSTARGLNILGLLGYNNSAQKAGVVNYDYPDINLWKRYVAAVVTHYKAQIHAWEVWNEPDVPYFWKAGVSQYLTLLRETYTTIKSIDPTAVVMNGACSNLEMGWFNQFLAEGGAQYTDVLAFHPYPKRSNLDNGLYESLDLPKLRDIATKTGKRWWFTEIGWASAGVGEDYGGGVGDDRAQASYMVRQYVQTLSFAGLNVDYVFWYNFRNDGTNPTDPENNYGLIQNDWRTPKYSYTAYQRMTAHLTGATPQGRVEAGAGPAYRFNRGGTTVDVIWGSGQASLTTASARAQAYDLVGGKLPTSVADGKILVQLSGAPAFVEHSDAPIALRTAPVSDTAVTSAPAVVPVAAAPVVPAGYGTQFTPGYPGYPSFGR